MSDTTEVNLIVRLPATHSEAITEHFVNTKNTELSINLDAEGDLTIAYRGGIADSNYELVVVLSRLKEAIAELESFAEKEKEPKSQRLRL